MMAFGISNIRCPGCATVWSCLAEIPDGIEHVDLIAGCPECLRFVMREQRRKRERRERP